MDPARTARRLWTLTEPYHAVTYYAPESRKAFEAVGLHGFWRGYFAGRAAPLGPVDAGAVTATFYGFHPAFVARAVPEVWSLASPGGCARSPTRRPRRRAPQPARPCSPRGGHRDRRRPDPERHRRLRRRRPPIVRRQPRPRLAR